MKTKKVTISITPEQQEKAKRDSIELFGQRKPFLKINRNILKIIAKILAQ